jgi:hypothetical protein
LITKKASPLTGSLLARKGGASPSFLAQVHPRVDGLPAALAHRPPRGTAPHANDAGKAAHSGSGSSTAEATEGGASRDHHGRIKLSFRLDQDRHLRLKLAAAHTDRHIQDILTAALDRYLTHLEPAVKSGGCTCYPKALPTDD